MIPETRTARAVIGAALAAGAIVALTGCGSGQVGTTGNVVSAVSGATARVKQIDVLDTSIKFPAGSAHNYQPGQSAELVFTIANSGGQPDKLVSISSTAAKRVVLSGSTDIPAYGKIATGTDGAGGLTATLQDLTTTVQSGPTYDVTFTFERSGSVTLATPIGSPGKNG